MYWNFVAIDGVIKNQWDLEKVMFIPQIKTNTGFHENAKLIILFTRTQLRAYSRPKHTQSKSFHISFVILSLFSVYLVVGSTDSSTLKMEAICSAETTVNLYQTAWDHTYCSCLVHFAPMRNLWIISLPDPEGRRRDRLRRWWWWKEGNEKVSGCLGRQRNDTFGIETMAPVGSMRREWERIWKEMTVTTWASHFGICLNGL
jgi:hypothetical protein